MTLMQTIPSADLAYYVIGSFVVVIFIIHRELLNRPKSFSVILLISIFLFIIGVWRKFDLADESVPVGSLLVPLLTLSLYQLLRYVFRRRFGSEPRDTAFIWREGMAKDRAFNILYTSLAILIWVLVSAFL